MREYSPARTLGQSDSRTEANPTCYERSRAAGICGVLALATFIASSFGKGVGPEIAPLVPMAATIWVFAEVLTATLLLAQFYVNGKTAYGILAASYIFSAAMAVPYLIAFPNLFYHGALTLGDEQLSIYFWMTWHVSFPALTICAAVGDAKRYCLISRKAVLRATAAAIVFPVIGSATVCAVVYRFRDALPRLLVHGHFQALLTEALIPSGIALSLFACLLLVRSKRLTALTLWLSVAIFSDALDMLLTGLSASRYSYAWDTGKMLTVTTASVVLVMILLDVATLYRRLKHSATFDSLTSLPNRGAFDERYRMAFDNEHRLQRSIALLVIDVDFFKRYNDSFGHLAGDDCLRRIAEKLALCVRRPLDIAARYGGEEFVVLLADSKLSHVLAIAEELRSSVESLAMTDAGAVAGATVSIGIGYADNAATTDKATLFDVADSALYVAKAAGRNCVRMHGPGGADGVSCARPQLEPSGEFARAIAPGAAIG